MVGALCVVMGLLVCGFFIYHLCLAATNTTTNESVKWSRLGDYREHMVKEYQKAKAAIECAEQNLIRAKEALDKAEGGAVKSAEEKVAAAELALTEAKRPRRSGESMDTSKQCKYVLLEPEPMPQNSFDKGILNNLYEMALPAPTSTLPNASKNK